MKALSISYMGREVGAIGILCHYCREIRANSMDEAVLKLYETHEHIHFLNKREWKNQ